jgi:hypothetical protein
MIKPAKNILTPVRKTGGLHSRAFFPKVKQVDQMKKQQKTKKSGILCP